MLISEAAFNWIMAHPWMTFFIALAVISAIKEIITSIAAIFNRNSKTNRVEVHILDKDGKEITHYDDIRRT